MMRWILIVFFALLLGACSAGINAYHQGNTAYENGDYYTSFANYLYAARRGVAPAQYAVGYQYYYGIGTKRDQPEGIRWFRRAANNSLDARYALQLIKENAPEIPWVLHLNRCAAGETTSRTSCH